MDEEIKQEILNVRQELFDMKQNILHPEWIHKVGLMIDKLDIIVSRVELPVMLPSVTIDEKALRFDFGDTGENLFWEDLFRGQRYSNFQDEIMKNLFKAYNQCVARST